jgi:formylglycine-generating enzyme required for sulfatase activity
LHDLGASRRQLASDGQALRTGAYALNRRVNRNQEIGFRVARTLEPDASIDLESAPELRTASSDSVASTNKPQDAQAVRGTTFRDCHDCPEMIFIPSGSLTMGSPPVGQTWDTRDLPQHRVTLNKDFALGVYDVTRAQYRLFAEETHRMSGGGCDIVDSEACWIADPGRSWRDPAFYQTDRDPVV